MNSLRKFVRYGLAIGGVGAAFHWAPPARAGHWVRATTATSEDVAMDYVGQRTIAVGGYGLNGQTDALWVLGQAQTIAPNNHYLYNWTGTGWSTISETAYVSGMALGGGSAFDYPYLIRNDASVWGGTGNVWYEYLPANTAHTLGFIQESNLGGNLWFADPTLNCWDNGACIDEYNVFEDYWVGKNISLGDGVGTDNLEANSPLYLPNGPYRLAVDPLPANGSRQIKIRWDNIAVPQQGDLSLSSDGGQTWNDCDPDIYEDTLPVLVDVCGYNGTYYGIEVGANPQNDTEVLPPRIATATTAEVCTGWAGLPCAEGTANCTYNSATGTYYDTTPTYAIACDASNGTLYSVQTQEDCPIWGCYCFFGNCPTTHYRVFRWEP